MKNLKNRHDHKTHHTRNKRFWINAAIEVLATVVSSEWITMLLVLPVMSLPHFLLSLATPTTVLQKIYVCSILYIANRADPHLQELNSNPKITPLLVIQSQTSFMFAASWKTLWCVWNTWWWSVELYWGINACCQETKPYNAWCLPFDVWCKPHPELDSQFQRFLDSTLRGDTVLLTRGWWQEWQ